MSKIKKIVLFDDDPEQAKGWRNDLQSRIDRDVEGMESGDFLDCIRVLEKRRKRARSGNPIEAFGEGADEPCLLDDVGIFFVDYDLLNVDEGRCDDPATYLTGEDVAYLARCYSRCDVVVALNQFGARTFDLRLQGHPESFADLNIGSEFFAGSGLWDDEWAEFRPWSWPLLPKLEADFSARLDDMREHLDRPILDFLDLSEERVGTLQREVSEFLETRDRNRTEVTFRDFVETSGQGLRQRDLTSTDNMQRIAAARVHQWLECFILAGQEVLVDAPHLVARFPSLLSGPPTSLDSWNATTYLREPRGFEDDLIGPQRFAQEHWLSRPAWYWSEVRKNSSIAEVRDPWGGPDTLDCVFCEDTSQFAPADTAEKFVSSVPSPFLRRYVARIDHVDYRPPIRFAL